MPPLRHSGFLISPTRARPVPFCCQGFLPLPETSARVFVLCVPERRLARYCFTAKCIRPSLTGPANTASAKSNWPTISLFKFLMFTVGIKTCDSSARFLDHYISARRTRHGAIHKQKVFLRIHPCDAKILYGHPGAAHV